MNRLKTTTAVTTEPANPLFARRGTFQITSEKVVTKWGESVDAQGVPDGNGLQTMAVIADTDAKAGEFI